MSKTKFVKQNFNEPKRKIEILKSAKGHYQKQKSTGQKPRIPKTQVGPHAKRNKNEGKESYQKTGVQTQPNMKQPPSFFFFQIV